MPSTSQSGIHSDITAKMNKFARWIKNSFRRSSAIFVEGAAAVGGLDSGIGGTGNYKKIAVITTAATSADGSASSSTDSNGGVTPPSEIVPSSGDEQL
ncbi:unnamed protein product [Gongylonema pulchrum]|uniref:P-loop containing nucleoside triphosphatehydrolases superfamily protein n=1 Tax=Gongylonema pulchrum TaxID=637853 RepID=A0A183D9T5_9BILA|nr:unnamed protein product [Gongylonema pulchrum]